MKRSLGPSPSTQIWETSSQSVLVPGPQYSCGLSHDRKMWDFFEATSNPRRSTAAPQSPYHQPSRPTFSLPANWRAEGLELPGIPWRSKKGNLLSPLQHPMCHHYMQMGLTYPHHWFIVFFSHSLTTHSPVTHHCQLTSLSVQHLLTSHLARICAHLKMDAPQDLWWLKNADKLHVFRGKWGACVFSLIHHRILVRVTINSGDCDMLRYKMVTGESTRCIYIYTVQLHPKQVQNSAPAAPPERAAPLLQQRGLRARAKWNWDTSIAAPKLLVCVFTWINPKYPKSVQACPTLCVTIKATLPEPPRFPASWKRTGKQGHQPRISGNSAAPLRHPRQFQPLQRGQQSRSLFFFKSLSWKRASGDSWTALFCRRMRVRITDHVQRCVGASPGHQLRALLFFFTLHAHLAFPIYCPWNTRGESSHFKAEHSEETSHLAG